MCPYRVFCAKLRGVGIVLLVRKAAPGSSRELLAVLLVCSVLLCHGALGVLHQTPFWPSGSSLPHHAAFANDAGVGVTHGQPQEDQQGGLLADSMNYAALVFTSLLLGGTLALLLRGFLNWNRIAAPRSSGLDLTIPVSYLVPGPKITFLGVFRL